MKSTNKVTILLLLVSILTAGCTSIKVIRNDNTFKETQDTQTHRKIYGELRVTTKNGIQRFELIKEDRNYYATKTITEKKNINFGWNRLTKSIGVFFRFKF